MTTNTNPDIPHRNRDADEQAFWDRVFHDEHGNELIRFREDQDDEGGSFADFAELADVAVKIRRKRLAPGSDWEGTAKTYERALEQIRGALGLTDIDEHETVLSEMHETVLSEIVRLKRIEKNAYAAPPWQLPSGGTFITDAMLPGVQLGQQPPQGDKPQEPQPRTGLPSPDWKPIDAAWHQQLRDEVERRREQQGGPTYEA